MRPAALFLTAWGLALFTGCKDPEPVDPAAAIVATPAPPAMGQTTGSVCSPPLPSQSRMQIPIPRTQPPM